MTDGPLIVQSDKTVLLDQSQRLRDVYQAAGLDVTMTVLPGAGHGGKEYNTPEVHKLLQGFLSKHTTRR